jgi:anti-sigma B factor antagonist
MQFKNKMVGDVLVLSPLSSFIDASVSTLFKGQVVDWIQKGYQHIVLDLSVVEFMDSSGLNALISLIKTMNRDNSLVLCNLQKAVRILFRITRFDQVISIYDSLDEACRNVNH